jgi:hypothetical protein
MKTQARVSTQIDLTARLRHRSVPRAIESTRKDYPLPTRVFRDLPHANLERPDTLQFAYTDLAGWRCERLPDLPVEPCQVTIVPRVSLTNAGSPSIT